MKLICLRSACCPKTQAEHPDFEQVLQITRMLREQSGYEFCRVVSASLEGNMMFPEVTGALKFRTALDEALKDGCLAEGLLCWQLDEGTSQARKLLFRWHSDPRLGSYLISSVRPVWVVLGRNWRASGRGTALLGGWKAQG